MRVIVNDYAGHPFQVQLSRELARRGHEITHLYMEHLQTPRGALAKASGDPDGLEIEGLGIGGTFEKYSLFKRPFQERAYGHLLGRKVDAVKPDIVISANTPLGSQAILQAACTRNSSKFIFWVQDLLGIGIQRVMKRKIPIAGTLIGSRYINLEKKLLRTSDAVVLITEDFIPVMDEWGVDPEKLQVIENWAPLDEMPPRPRDNPWAREHGLAGKTCLLYSGTLGFKHDPDLLLGLSRHFRGREDVNVVVVSEGFGADWLKEQKAAHGLDNLTILDFQPYAVLPDVLSGGDILVAILEPDAGVFSVPSKVLTYMCVGRPLLLAVPPENLAARIVSRNEAGLVVPPGDAKAFIAAAEKLVNDPQLRAYHGDKARRYALNTFDMDRLGDRFEGLFRTLLHEQPHA